MKYPMTVVIPTVGIGSRMKKYTKNLNKSLLVYKQKPIISHIIEKFPADTRFVIPIGYLKDQVRDYCRLAYPEKNIEFIEVDNYDGLYSGSRHTLSMCKSSVKNPFWYITCDTYFDQLITEPPITDTVFCAKVAEEKSSLYTMYKFENDIPIAVSLKEKTHGEDWVAWTGMMYIQDWRSFFETINQTLDPEVQSIIPKNVKYAPLNDWIDFGNENDYKRLIEKEQAYDDSKPEEVTYITNNKVLKYFFKQEVGRKKLERAKINPDIFPSNINILGDWMVYDYVNGSTMYEVSNIELFKKLLKWAETSIWIKPSTIDVIDNASNFYYHKSKNRIEDFIRKYPDINKINFINGIQVKEWQYYFNSIPFDTICYSNEIGFVHGDFHFDNTIVHGDQFTGIDWRPEFGTSNYGDICYDIIKMSSCILLDLSKIKKRDFSFIEYTNSVELVVPTVDNYKEYFDVLTEFIKEKKWDYEKIQWLIPLVYWNMAPLHNPPFDKLLWYYGILLFHRILEKTT